MFAEVIITGHSTDPVMSRYLGLLAACFSFLPSAACC